MPSFQTISRAVVMIGVGFIAVKGWQAYGPTTAQLERAYSQLKDVVQASLPSSDVASATAAVDPRIAPKTGTATLPPAPMPGPQLQLLPPTPPATAQNEAPKLLPSGAPPVAPLTQSPSPSAGTLSKVTPVPILSSDRVAELVARLQRLGVENTSLAPWGNGGLYRFTCSAPLVNAPMMTQHFESVAAEPALAVEQVVAKVEAWRVTQREGGILRY